MAKSYKSLKEDFVSGLSGGEVSEINAVTLVAPAAYLLWGVLQSRHRFFEHYGVSQFTVDFLLNVGAILLVTTVYSGIPIILNICIFVAALSAYVLGRNPRPSQRPRDLATGETSPKQELSIPSRPFLSTYRGAMMVITCISILAIDFKVFPRRFAKVETWGTSLVDIGVGSFVFAAGLVSARPLLKARAAGKRLSPRQRAKSSIKGSVPLLILGLIRLYSVKSLDYAEHVSEYGVHWNFFFTLGFLPPFLACVEPLSDTVRCHLLPFLILMIYEIALNSTSLKAYILVAPRDNLLSQNREGIFSFGGYLAIFLAAQGVGLDILPRRSDDNSTPISGSKAKYYLVKVLGLRAIGWYLLYALSTSFRFGLRLQTSRRLTNAPYVEWVMWFNCGQMLLFYFVEALLFPNLDDATDPQKEARNANQATSQILRAFNRNGLAVFLLANLLTGLVNLTMDTLNVETTRSMLVLGLYALTVTGVAVALDRWDVSIKLR